MLYQTIKVLLVEDMLMIDKITEQMLKNMFIGDPPGNHDRLLDFSTPVTGTLFFVPTADFLDDLPEAPAPLAQKSPAPPVYDGSLGIGDLKRSLAR